MRISAVTFREAARRYGPLALGLLVLATFYAVKSTLYANLEYLGDIFSALQMSRGFAWGRPLLYENAMGRHAAAHNYYLLPFFFPLTSWLHGRGLFLGLLLLDAAALVRIDSFARRLDAERRRLLAAVAICFLLGPVAFWMLDDVPQGWHVELVFLPLGILFALDLRERRRRAWLWAAAIVLAREEGAVLAWAIHALHLLTERGESTDAPARRRRLVRVTTGWFAVFVAGLLWLAHEQREAHRPSRLAQSIAHALALPGDPEIRGPLLAGYAGALVLLAAGALVLLAGIPAKTLAAAALVSLPLAVVQGIGALTYLGSSIQLSGPSWPPRFTLLWTMLAVALVFGIGGGELLPARSRRLAFTIAAVALSLLAQVPAIAWARSYSVLFRMSPRVFLGGEGLNARRFTSAELTFLRGLGRRLPARTTVLTNFTLFAPLDAQDLVFPDQPYNAYVDTFPQVTVCDGWGRLMDDGCRKDQAALPRPGFEEARVDGLIVTWNSSVAAEVKECLPSR